MKKIVFPAVLCCLICAAGCTSGYQQKEEAGKYTVTSPLKVDTTITKEYVAQIQSVKNIEIRAQEKGYLESINVDEGQTVKAGQVLFRIMPTLYKAEFLKAKAAVKEAELEMLNVKTLADKDIVSGSEAAIAQAKLDEAKAEMELARLHLSLTEIRAPYDGVIDRLPLKLGSLIEEGALLTTLSDNKSVFAYFNVPEREYLDFKSHTTGGKREDVNLVLANSERFRYKGQVETIEGEFDNNTGNIAFRARFPNPDLLLKHGETGKVQMSVPLKNALIIPQKATYELQDKIYVFVVDKNNKVRSRNISVKNSMPDLYVVDAGLSQGDRIILDGVQNVRDDDRIRFRFINPANVIASLQLIR